jgi:hypothetical protein
MEVLFLKGCATVNNVYKKGGVYSLPDSAAKSFINAGLAKEVGDKPKTKAKPVIKTADNAPEQTAANKGTGRPVKRRTRTKK